MRLGGLRPTNSARSPQSRAGRRTLFLFSLLAGLALADVARAGTPQDLEMAEKAYGELDYERANKLAEVVVRQRGLSHDQLVRAYRILARSHAILDHEAAARDAFVLLFTYSPDEEEDKRLPPRITDRMMEARGTVSGYSAKPGISVSTVLRSDEAGTLRVTTRDPGRIATKVVVGWRWGAHDSYTTSNITAGEGVTVDVSAPPRSVSRLDYYAQALDDRDDVVFEAGNPGAPKTALVDVGRSDAGGGGVAEKGGSKSIFASPVTWIIIGGVLIGGGVTAYALATRKPRDETLPPTQANMSPALFCGGTGDGKCH